MWNTGLMQEKEIPKLSHLKSHMANLNFFFHQKKGNYYLGNYKNYKPEILGKKKKNKFVSGRWPENLNAKCIFFFFFFLARC